MTEPFMTAVTVKITLPSNYAENRRGAEVSLSGSFPEGTTCEQAKSGHNELATEALRVAEAMQSGSIPEPTSVIATAATTKSSDPAPATTAAKPASRKKPSEIVIGAAPAGSTSLPAVGETVAATSAPVAGSPAEPLPTSSPVTGTSAPLISIAAVQLMAQDPSLASIPSGNAPAPVTTEAAPAPVTTTVPTGPSEAPFDGPFVGAPTAAPAALATASSGSEPALPSIPASTGTVPVDPTLAGATSGPGSSASSVATLPTTVSEGATSPSNPTSAPVVSPGLPQSVAPVTQTSSTSPNASGPVDAASPSAAATPVGVGGDPLADTSQFQKMIGHEARRLNSLGDAQGQAAVNLLNEYTGGKGAVSAFVPVERRQELLDKLKAMI